VPKFSRTTPLNSKVIGVHLTHFKPIFDPPSKKNLRGAPVPSGVCARKTWSFSNPCKNLGGSIS